MYLGNSNNTFAFTGERNKRERQEEGDFGDEHVSVWGRYKEERAGEC